MNNISEIDNLFNAVGSKDDKARFAAFQKLLVITEQPVSWIYDKWFLLTEKLESKNSYQRTIGFMLIANLCKSDTQNRLSQIIDKLLDVTNDEKFITARQAFQNVWKIALHNRPLEPKIMNHLENEWAENIHLSSHPNLIKQDIISSIKKVYDSTKNEALAQIAEKLIGLESDEKLIKTLKKIMH